MNPASKIPQNRRVAADCAKRVCLNRQALRGKSLKSRERLWVNESSDSIATALRCPVDISAAMERHPDVIARRERSRVKSVGYPTGRHEEEFPAGLNVRRDSNEVRPRSLSSW